MKQNYDTLLIEFYKTCLQLFLQSDLTIWMKLIWFISLQVNNYFYWTKKKSIRDHFKTRICANIMFIIKWNPVCECDTILSHNWFSKTKIYSTICNFMGLKQATFYLFS